MYTCLAKDSLPLTRRDADFLARVLGEGAIIHTCEFFESVTSAPWQAYPRGATANGPAVDYPHLLREVQGQTFQESTYLASAGFLEASLAASSS